MRGGRERRARRRRRRVQRHEPQPRAQGAAARGAAGARTSSCFTRSCPRRSRSATRRAHARSSRTTGGDRAVRRHRRLRGLRARARLARRRSTSSTTSSAPSMRPPRSTASSGCARPGRATWRAAASPCRASTTPAAPSSSRSRRPDRRALRRASTAPSSRCACGHRHRRGHQRTRRPLERALRPVGRRREPRLPSAERLRTKPGIFLTERVVDRLADTLPLIDDGEIETAAGTQRVWRIDPSADRGRVSRLMTDLLAQPWFWPAVAVIVGLPISLLVLGELHSTMVRTRHPGRQDRAAHPERARAARRDPACCSRSSRRRRAPRSPG